MHTPETVELAKYFVPQSPLPGYARSIGDSSSEFNVKANPFAFTERDVLRFDQGFIDIFKRSRPKFCGVYHLFGQYKSKSGYETLVMLRPDADGDFRVSYIERLFSSPSLDSILLLEKELKERYAPYMAVKLMVEVERKNFLQLRLKHPMGVTITGPGSGQYKELRDAFWSVGWLDFKGKELESNKIMHAIAEHNKTQYPICKPQVLNVD